MDPIVRSVSDSKESSRDSLMPPQQQQSDRPEEGVSGSLQSLELERAGGNLVVADEIPSAVEKDDDEEEMDEEEDEYEYEDDEDHFSGFLVDNPAVATAQAAAASSEPATIEQEESTVAAPPPPEKKWRQPSEEAVNMSLRAEKETTGGKRRARS